MSLKVGFAGAHRTGKTTLAAAIANDIGYPLTNGSCTPAFVSSNRKPADVIPFTERFDIQLDILKRYKESICDKSTFFIDRTGVDFMAYTSAELSTNQYLLLDNEVLQSVSKYMDECLKSAEELDILFIVPPGIKIVNDGSKGVCDEIMIEKIHSLIYGFACRLENVVVHLIDRSQTDLSQRKLEAIGVIYDYIKKKTS